ncbi:hypothetical protein [Rudaea sp.]|uniref:hypothetical protein n=1 Tax=Rudaea sp. TaxID=2136325 RepID=UPI00321F71F2
MASEEVAFATGQFVPKSLREMVPLVVGVTSHRNLLPEEIEPIRQRVREFFAILRREFPDMPLVVLSPLAEGGDQCVAEEALASGALLVAPLPMSRESYARDFEEPQARARFERLCAAAAIIEVPDATGGLTQGAHTDAERDLYYAQAGVYVSNHAHILLAIWDGKDSGMHGGTAQVVRYHFKGIKPSYDQRQRGGVHTLDDESERLAYHIVCSRDQVDGSPPPALRPLDTWWRMGSRAIPGTQAMPEEFRAIFLAMREFVDDAEKYADRIETAVAAETSQRAADSPPASDRLFRPADWLAGHFQRRVLLTLRALYTMAALMAIAFVAFDDLPDQDSMIFVFLLLFALGGGVALLANRRGWHRKYLDYRALAEGLRVQSYWHRAGLSLTDDVEFGRDNFLRKQDLELGWVRNVLRCGGLANDLGGRMGSVQEVRSVIRQWVGDDQHGGQLDYYRRKAAQRARMHKLTERIGTASLLAGAGISVVLALFLHAMSQDTRNELIVVMAVFSIVGGVRLAYAHKKADKELIKQYRYMRRIFGEAREALDHAADVEEQRDILRLLGNASLSEQVEWTLMHRQRPLEHNRI